MILKRYRRSGGEIKFKQPRKILEISDFLNKKGLSNNKFKSKALKDPEDEALNRNNHSTTLIHLGHILYLRVKIVLSRQDVSNKPRPSPAGLL